MDPCLGVESHPASLICYVQSVHNAETTTIILLKYCIKKHLLLQCQWDCTHHSKDLSQEQYSTLENVRTD